MNERKIRQCINICRVFLCQYRKILFEYEDCASLFYPSYTITVDAYHKKKRCLEAIGLDCKEKILSEEYIDFVIDFPLEEIFSSFSGEMDFCYQEIGEGYGIISINRNQLPDTTLLTLDYHYFPDLMGLQQEEIGEIPEGQMFDPSPLIASGITQIQDAPLNLHGRGVILAFADTGINYENAVFRRSDGSSRILSIWDQTIQNGEPPEGFYIGTEYTREQINEALESDNPRQLVPTVDEDGHGTRMASLAAGSRLTEGASYVSPAYEADILVVKLRPAKRYLREYYQIPDTSSAYASSDIMMAVKYLNSFARAFRRPIVFCMGLGSNYRDHEGNSVFSRYLNDIASQQSRIMVVAGGNEGDASHHFSGRFEETASGRGTEEVNMEVYVSEGVSGFLLQIWTSAPVNLAVSIRTPGGEYVAPVSVLFQTNLRYRFVFEETVITVYNAYIAQGSGDALVLLRFENPTAGIWTVGVSDTEGTKGAGFDAWLPIQTFLEQPVYFLEPSPNITLTSPSYASDAITVAAYNSFDNSIYRSSGRGYSRDGQIKPDLAAPGVNITIAGNRLGSTPRISTYTGSSLAAAITAGGAAQFMQWAVIDGNSPYIRSQELKNYFIRGAKREENQNYPNRTWGYGRLDLYGTFLKMRNM